MSRSFRWLILLSWLLPFGAMAVELGTLRIHSSLGEPLLADIELIDLPADTFEGLSITLASEDEYVSLTTHTQPEIALNLDLIHDAVGIPRLRITSRQPAQEPFMVLLLRVELGERERLREYTVLLDPPAWRRPSLPAVAQQPALHRDPDAAQTRATAPEPSFTTPAAASAEHPPLPREYGPVRRGETLNMIVNALITDQPVTVSQMMLAILQYNPHAFADNNVNRLRAGVVLNIPDPETASLVSHEEAQALIREQHRTFQEQVRQAQREREVAEAVPQLPAETAVEPSPHEHVDASKPEPRLRLLAADDEDSAETAARAPVQELTQTDPDTAGSASRGLGLLDRELALAQEELEVAQRQKEVLLERVEELEAQNDQIQQLLQMQNELLMEIMRLRAEAEAGRPSENLTQRLLNEPLLAVLFTLLLAIVGILLYDRHQFKRQLEAADESTR